MSALDLNTNRRPVMNSPADEAEARDRVNAAPSPADPDAGCRGVSGLTSGSEARPVTPTAHFSEAFAFIAWHRHYWPEGHGICPRFCHACWTKGHR